MSWITTLFSSGVDKVVDSVADGLDNLFTSDEEKLILKNKLQTEMNKLSIELESKRIEYEKELTKRWESDNQHMLTRLVRPALVVYAVVVFTIIAVADGNWWGFTVNPLYIPLFGTLLVTTVGGYFTLRTFDKHSKNKHKGSDDANG